MIDVLREVAVLGIVTVVMPLGLWLGFRLLAAVWRALRAL
jgi:hypothetical protein